MSSRGSPLVCDTGALTATERGRHRSVTSRLRDKVVDVERLECGYRLWLPGDLTTMELVAEFVSRERLCCPFLSFTVTVPSGDERMGLELTGPAGTRELLSAALRIE